MACRTSQMEELEPVLNLFEKKNIIRKVDKLPYPIEPKPKGRGQFGVVYRGLDPKTGKKVAVKVIQVSHLLDQPVEKIESFFLELLAEINSIKRLSEKCPDNVIHYVDALWDNDKAQLYIVTEWHPGMTVNRWISSEKRTPQELEKVIDNALKGLLCIHQHNIAHRDIKPSNMMVDPTTLQVKYIDLGLACLSNVCRYSTGTMPFRLAPEFSEVMEDDQSTLEEEKKIDLWALGVSIYAMLLGNETKLPLFLARDSVKLPDDFRFNRINAVIRALLEVEPNKRDLAKALRPAEKDMPSPILVRSTSKPIVI